MIFALILCAAGQLPAGCPTLPARGAAGQDRLPTCRAAGPTLPSRGAAGPSLGEHCRPRGAADVPRCRSTPGRLPHAPGPWCAGPVTREALPAPWCCRRAALPVNSRPVAPRSRPVADVLPAPRSRPVVLPARHSGSIAGPVVLPTCRAAGQLPADCPTLPARGAPAPSRGKHCRPRGAADVPRCRSTPGRLPHAPGRLPHAPGRLPTCCRPHAPGPWCCRPVTREALPARGAADVPRVSAVPVLCDSAMKALAAVLIATPIAADRGVADRPAALAAAL